MFKQGWYTPDPVSCPFLCFLCRSSPPNFVLYESGLGWSCIGLLRQSFEVGPGYYLYFEGLVGFDEGGRWVVSLLHYGQEHFHAKCRGVGVVMDVIDLPLCLRNFFGKLF